MLTFFLLGKIEAKCIKQSILPKIESSFFSFKLSSISNFLKSLFPFLAVGTIINFFLFKIGIKCFPTKPLEPVNPIFFKTIVFCFLWKNTFLILIFYLYLKKPPLHI